MSFSHCLLGIISKKKSACFCNCIACKDHLWHYYETLGLVPFLWWRYLSPMAIYIRGAWRKTKKIVLTLRRKKPKNHVRRVALKNSLTEICTMPPQMINGQPLTLPASEAVRWNWSTVYDIDHDVLLRSCVSSLVTWISGSFYWPSVFKPNHSPRET